MQQASCLEGGPLLWIWPLNLHVNQKSDDDDDPSEAGHSLWQNCCSVYLAINVVSTNYDQVILLLLAYFLLRW